jgi:hypothetical protein
MELIDWAKTTFEYLWRDEMKVKSKESGGELRTMCGSRTGGWSLPCVMSD